MELQGSPACFKILVGYALLLLLKSLVSSGVGLNDIVKCGIVNPIKLERKRTFEKFRTSK